MSRKTPKEVLWVLDYEDYLKSGVQMPGDGRRWVDEHKAELDTPAKRQLMLDRLRVKFKQPKISPVSPSTVARRKNKRLAREFAYRYDQLKGLGGSGQILINLSKYYRRKGVSYYKISQITGVTVYGLKKRGI